MKYCLLSFILLLAVGPVAAQVSSAAIRPDSPVATRVVPMVAEATSAAPDTVAAIHRLFAARRKTSHILTGIIAGSATVVVVGDGFSTGVVYMALAAPYEIAILLIYRRYTKKAEARALAALQAHRLSLKLKKRLKANYFR